ncbi:MAG: hypothetical protein U0835_13260 [Isosphaeraceae bacterium]
MLANHFTNLRLAALGLNDAAARRGRRGLAELAASDPRLRALDARLAAVRQGEPPKDPAERLGLARRAYQTRHFALSARLWDEALEADEKLAPDRETQHAYNAACAAALAASGQGADDPPPDDAGKTRLRGQALAWLQGELAAWSKFAEGGSAEAKAAVARTLDQWTTDPDLAGVRDADALDKLPEAEKQAWRAFWAEVAALRARL